VNARTRRLGEFDSLLHTLRPRHTVAEYENRFVRLHERVYCVFDRFRVTNTRVRNIA
jgi:hypothetical protein